VGMCPARLTRLVPSEIAGMRMHRVDSGGDVSDGTRDDAGPVTVRGRDVWNGP